VLYQTLQQDISLIDKDFFTFNWDINQEAVNEVTKEKNL
jgi:hypothetical protein